MPVSPLRRLQALLDHCSTLVNLWPPLTEIPGYTIDTALLTRLLKTKNSTMHQFQANCQDDTDWLFSRHLPRNRSHQSLAVFCIQMKHMAQFHQWRGRLPNLLAEIGMIVTKLHNTGVTIVIGELPRHQLKKSLQLNGLLFGVVFAFGTAIQCWYLC